MRDGWASVLEVVGLGGRNQNRVGFGKPRAVYGVQVVLLLTKQVSP